LDWDFAANRNYRCISHRTSGGLGKEGGGKNGEAFQHALFSELAATEPSEDVPANLDTGVGLQNGMDEDDDSSSASVPKRAAMADLFRTEKLHEYEGEAVDLRLVNAIRGSLTEKWNMKLEASVDETTGSRILSIAGDDLGRVADGLHPGDIICTMNGVRVGTPALDTIEKALKILSQEVEVLMEVCSSHVQDDAWG
jgi:hypothetical protein